MDLFVENQLPPQAHCSFNMQTAFFCHGDKMEVLKKKNVNSTLEKVLIDQSTAL